jgi:branched-chain amino acid transport system substrate-binding protein
MKLPNPRLLLTAAVLVTAFTIAASADGARGVTDTEIVIGTISDLSGVTSVQGVNNIDAIRMAFDDANAKGGIHGRKIRYIVEDMQYLMPKAIEGINKLLNRDEIFFAIANDGTSMNNAVMPLMFAKNVPNVFPLSPARPMYEPFGRLKFGFFASYYDQMRAGTKYFVEHEGKKAVCILYQQSDFGREIRDGTVEQLSVMGMKSAGEATDLPTDIDFNATIAKLRGANCDLVVLGTIVRDTVLILQTARKMGWNVDMLGQVASYSTAVAEAPGNPAEGFYSMTPGLYAYPDDPRPAVQTFAREFKERFGIDVNYMGETGYSAAQFVLAALDKAGRDLTLDSFIGAMESIRDHRDIFDSPPMSLSATNHHASNQAFLAVIRGGRWVAVDPNPLGY